MTAPIDIAGVEKLCALMVKHGIVELKVGTVHLRRAPAEPPPRESEESALQRLARMRPDEQDRALMLQKTGGG